MHGAICKPVQPSQRIRMLLAGRKVKDEYLTPTPQVDRASNIGSKRVIDLEALVEMKLNSYRSIDRTHLTDMIQIGLVDSTWPIRYAKPLGDRLQALLDDPEG